MKKNRLLLMIIAMMCVCMLLVTACGGGGESGESSDSTATEETAEESNASETDFLIGSWFAKECRHGDETADPDDIFGGTFYLLFDEDGDCTMSIDQKHAMVKWEYTGDGVTLTGDNTYQITFPDDSKKTMVITINDVETLMEKYEE